MTTPANALWYDGDWSPVTSFITKNPPFACAGGNRAFLVHVGRQACVAWLVLRGHNRSRPLVIPVRADLGADDGPRALGIGPVESARERPPQGVAGHQAELGLPSPVSQSFGEITLGEAEEENQ